MIDDGVSARDAEEGQNDRAAIVSAGGRRTSARGFSAATASPSGLS
jgi:hypothetical protein